MAAERWRVAGTYLESCNCEAICPCRRINGVQGGRSQYGVCLFALSWLVKEGSVGDVDVSGLAIVLAARYSDDEPGSPWDYILYIDERADERQHAALEDVFTGRLRGSAVDHFPWAWKPSNLLAVRSAAIDIDHSPRGWFRGSDAVTVRIRSSAAPDSVVTCVIPGHDRAGEEVVTDHLRVADGPLSFEFEGRCGYRSTFDYVDSG
jgi:hypothetical protein